MSIFTSWWRRMALFPSEAMHALLARNCQSLLGAHGRHALGEKHVARFGLLALQSSQRTYLRAAHRVHARRAVLDPPHVQETVPEVHLIPPNCAQLRYPEARAGTPSGSSSRRGGRCSRIVRAIAKNPI